MQRREFVTLLGGGVAAWPLAARAQQRAEIPVVGQLIAGGQSASGLAAMRKSFSEMGFVEGQNVLLETRATNGQNDRLPALAAELVRRSVSVIMTFSPNATQAAKAATATIPIVFATGIGDPVKLGLVASITRPGGNITGVNLFASELLPKRLELLRELVPKAITIGVLTNPTSLSSEEDVADVQAAARSVGQQIMVLNASTPGEIDTAFATAAQRSVGALLVPGDNLFSVRRPQLAVLAARYGIPASYAARDYVLAGGLMSYGDDRVESFRQAYMYVGRILKGEKPANLPVLQPVKFDFVINLSTAKALGLTFPPSFHLRATEVIE